MPAPSSSLFSDWPEFGQGDLRRDVLEDDRYFHADLNFFHRAVHDVGGESDFPIRSVRRDLSHHVGHLGREDWYGRIVDDDERVHLAGPGYLRPLIVPGAAVRAERSRRPAELTAASAAGRAQFMVVASVPEWLSFRIGNR